MATSNSESISEQNREGALFDEIAAPFLGTLGFELLDDPSVVRSPYLMTRAMYQSSHGLYLCVGFEPADGNYAAIFCGRQWTEASGWSTLSNQYAILANQFGFEVPRSYVLGYEDEIPKTMERILEDLRATLPAVIEQMTLDDLIQIEGEKFGAQQKALGYFGPEYFSRVEISKFPS